MRTLIVPGWNGSGPNHWQTVWQAEHPEYQRLQPNDWHNPTVADWVGALHETIVLSHDRVFFVAHSLGCLTIAWWQHLFPQHTGRVAAALLVAPPDLRGLAPLRAFDPAPREPLRFPSLLVGSENDPYMTLDAAYNLARDWGCPFVNAGAAGHINADSGFGRWPQGQSLMQQLRQQPA